MPLYTPGVAATILIVGLSPLGSLAYWLYWKPLSDAYDEDAYFKRLMKYETDVHKAQVCRKIEIDAYINKQQSSKHVDHAVNARLPMQFTNLLTEYNKRNKEE